MLSDNVIPISQSESAITPEHCFQCNTELLPSNISHSNPIFCAACAPVVTVTTSVTTKTEEVYIEKTDQIVLKKHEAKKITFDGGAWLHSRYAIANRTDTEVLAAIEIMRAHIHLMESELLERRVKKAKEQNLIESKRRVISTALPRVKIATAKGAKLSQVEKLAESFKAKGVTAEMLLALAQKLGGKV